jgi:hypothetical protein
MSELERIIDLGRYMSERPAVAAKILCAEDVQNWMRGLPPGPPAGALLGIPVYVNPAMEPGDWMIVDRDGNVLARAGVASPGSETP